MTLKDWVQLFFALSNITSFLLTFLHGWRPKLAGSLLLVVAHPTVAAYFLSTGQPIFVLGNAAMTLGGLYGTWRALRARRTERRNDAIAAAVREGWAKGFERSWARLPPAWKTAQDAEDWEAAYWALRAQTDGVPRG